MVNAWSLLYDVMEEQKKEKENKSPIPGVDISDQGPGLFPEKSDSFRFKPSEKGNNAEKHEDFINDDDYNDFWYGGDSMSDTIMTGSRISGGEHSDTISLTNYNPYVAYMGTNSPDTISFNTNSSPEPSLNKPGVHKYEEDKGIADLKDYVDSTYSGHYTTKGSNVQTLDLIESVGDAESFCRSNAIKYLSRYDKKGQAKRDILKALHYCLLLYYFSGNTKNEITSRGYETF